MAQRGSPLPFAVREAIKQLRQSGATVRQTAATTGTSTKTVLKYNPKPGRPSR